MKNVKDWGVPRPLKMTVAEKKEPDRDRVPERKGTNKIIDFTPPKFFQTGDMFTPQTVYATEIAFVEIDMFTF